MKIDNISGRLAATLLGFALASGGASLLFGDVIFGHADFTQKHFQTVCIVFGTTIAAYAAHHAWNNRHLAACLGLALIAAAGTGLIVWNSLGRQTEGVMVASGAYDKIVSERRDLEASLARDRASIDEKRAAADKECASGEGSRCRGARSSVVFYENSAKGTEARIKLLETPKPVDPSAEAFGNLAAALGFNKEKAKALSMLFMPYFVVLFFEFGTTISFGYAFSPKRHLRAEAPKPLPALPAPTVLANVTDADLVTVRQNFTEPPDRPREGGIRTVRPSPDGPPKQGGLSKEEALQHVLTELAFGRTVPSQQALANLSGRDKRRVSEWVREWERGGLIPARTQAGRCKLLTAAN